MSNDKSAIKIAEKDEQIATLKKRKKFGLVWENKPEDVVEQCKKEFPVLEEVKNLAISTDDSKPTNLLIEGDNYHALSVLNYTHKGKIDVIYIDPPYNTKNKDFKYNDRFVDQNDSYKHSKWLSFMNKRLRLTRNLLSNKGVIFISINDNEQAYLKLLCDNIFGESNFIANLVWENKEGGGGGDSSHFKIKHEYILVYAKSKDSLIISGIKIEDEARYKEKDKHVKERGMYQLVKLDSASIQYSSSLDYPILSPDNTNILPANGGAKSCWRWNKEKVKWGIENDFIVIKKNGNDKWAVYTKQYLKVDKDNNQIERDKRQIGVISKFSTTQSNRKIKEIFSEVVFKYSKPYELMELLLKISTNKKSIVLDFFAGSGTTGHAVSTINKKDGGNRRYILCTNNESDIARKICYPRMKYLINGYEYTGEEKTLLLEKKITVSVLKKIDLIIDNIEQSKKQYDNEYDNFPTKIEENSIKLYGVKKYNGKKEGLGGNLKYYKTAFVPAQPTDQNKKKLMQKATDMLCVRENTFEQVTSVNAYKIYRNKNRYTGIIYNEDAIENFKKVADKLKGHVNVYVFSLGDEDFEEEFADMKDKVKPQPIPEAIMRAYRRIFK